MTTDQGDGTKPEPRQHCQVTESYKPEASGLQMREIIHSLIAWSLGGGEEAEVQGVICCGLRGLSTWHQRNGWTVTPELIDRA